MKSIVWAAAVVFSIMAATAAHAQSKVYTWTDAKGKLHITDEPPPVEASLKDVVESPPVSPAEVRQSEQQRMRQGEKRLDELRRSEMEETLRRAREADQRAQEAIQRADEQTRQALEYRKRFSNTAERRENYKYKIRDEEQKAEAARTEAQKAIDQARAAAEEARTAAGQLQQGTKP